MVFSFQLESPIDGVPIVPGRSYILGHLPLLRDDDFRVVLTRFAVTHANEKGRCTFFMGPKTPSLSVTQVEDVQTLLRATSHREFFPMAKPHLDNFLGRNSIGAISGKAWKTQRTIIIKAMHGRGFIEQNVEAIRIATQTLVDRLATEDCVDDIGEIFKMLTLDIFGRAALHMNFECCEKLEMSPIGSAFQFLASEFLRRAMKDILIPASHMYSIPTPANLRHARERKFIKEYVSNLIEERKELLKDTNVSAAQVPQDLLTRMIQQVEETEGTDSSSMETTMFDNVMSLLFAGYETTSMALTYSLYMISQHPEVETKCLEELSSSQTTTSDDYNYLKAVITETLRLYPPAISTTRSADRDMTLDGIHIPKDTYLYFPTWSIQRDPNIFVKPDEFHPERWAVNVGKGKWNTRDFKQDEATNLSDTISAGTDTTATTNINDSIPAGNPRAFLAFSTGARSCAGQRFAMQEMIIALSVLLPAYKFIPPKDYVLTPYQDGLVQRPKEPIPMKIFKRT